MPDKAALYWKEAKDKAVRCGLCPHKCLINESNFGVCNARRNLNGVLYSQSYGIISALNIDPVEKKPLFHFHPGEKTLSLGSYGCNFTCGFCQNFSISAVRPPKKDIVSPEDALYFASEKNIKLISYTYNEPLINYEWLLETCELARKKGMENILVTNGYINEEPLKRIAEWIDAANVDLKAFSGAFYKKNCGGSLEPVLKSIEILHKSKIHVELTNLVIDNENTSEMDFQKMLDFIANLSDEIPLHISRYFPSYRFELAPTKEETLIRFYETAKKKLKYVYIGNFSGQKYESTYCKKCGFCIIERKGYKITPKCKNLRICCECEIKNNIIT